jgi:hypothetical protein
MTTPASFTRWAEDFADGDRSRRALLEGKEVNVAEITRVPGADPMSAGCTITTEASIAILAEGRYLKIDAEARKARVGATVLREGDHVALNGSTGEMYRRWRRWSSRLRSTVRTRPGVRRSGTDHGRSSECGLAGGRPPPPESSAQGIGLRRTYAHVARGSAAADGRHVPRSSPRLARPPVPAISSVGPVPGTSAQPRCRKRNSQPSSTRTRSSSMNEKAAARGESAPSLSRVTHVPRATITSSGEDFSGGGNRMSGLTTSEGRG